ncbi:oxygen-insensitive NAD(P)H nitroreductase [Acinetobacter rathckeae]|uniref:oxygen-insensitive NAD(P)H nitroreductase n=1 Tax=Acinetobacter rathckeae TaxID=2605272 RepID=UPI0018A334A5|nr:oxygen-insensitive NAD(P)H nitroreductase [Acinetobacter rathckeae]MBF7694352.1 oxygen-insensitive NAD(P)H nitroreductase [Acinetobacter rathckeae]
MDILEVAQTRYTTKAYDPNKVIAEADFLRLLEVLRLTPSSVNIQPWHVYIAQTPVAKHRVALSMGGMYESNAVKVLNASHTLVLCTRTDVTDSHLEQLLEQEDRSGRFKSAEAKQGQAKGRSGYIHLYRNERQNLDQWLENQTFIALGQLLLAAGAEGIDATPIGGFDEKTLSDELELEKQGLKPSVVVTLGYRSDTDTNATSPKARFQDKYIFTSL